MRTFVGLCIVVGLLQGAFADENGSIHAVLVAGSSGYWNYRHQADICHAYHVLTDHGIAPEHIITMMYDDIADNEDNPFPGKIFNQPNGVDVYPGVKIDYSGYDVTPENFMAILKGDAKATRGGNGRVLKSGKNDKVFIYFADHGAPGLIAFPEDELTVHQLNKTLQHMYDKNMYGQLVFYLETCESGSMFEGILPSNMNILAVTAANAEESSWGCYCQDPVLDTCLGDLFSVNWMEDSDIEDLSTETLEEQYQVVKNKTDASHVMQYGDLTINPEVLATFQGHSNRAPDTKFGRALRHFGKKQVNPKQYARWASRDIPIKTVEARLKRTTDPKKRKQLERQLAEMQMKRRYVDMHTQALVHKLAPKEAMQVLTTKPAGINDVDCHHQVVKAYSRSCFNLGSNPYALTAVAPLTNLCDQGLAVDQIVATVKSHCARKNVHMKAIH